MYYGFGALNIFIPILQSVFFVSHPILSSYLNILMSLLWIGTSVVMILALVIITRSLDAETNAKVKVKEISLHISAFTIFAVDCTYCSIMNYYMVEDFAIVAMTKMIDSMIVGTVLDSVCGFILMYIFCIIYIAVRDAS